METRKKKPAGLARFLAASLAVSLVIPALADDFWDTSKRVEVTPASSASVTFAGLNAKARGLDDTDGTDIDISSMTWLFSNECWIRCTPPRGLWIVIQ